MWKPFNESPFSQIYVSLLPTQNKKGKGKVWPFCKIQTHSSDFFVFLYLAILVHLWNVNSEYWENKSLSHKSHIIARYILGIPRNKFRIARYKLTTARKKSELQSIKSELHKTFTCIFVYLFCFSMVETNFHTSYIKCTVTLQFSFHWLQFIRMRMLETGNTSYIL